MRCYSRQLVFAACCCHAIYSNSPDRNWKRLFHQQGVIGMNNIQSSIKGYALAVLLGAVGGGLLVSIATKAIPKMMSGLMQNMMMQMNQNGFNPGEK